MIDLYSTVEALYRFGGWTRLPFGACLRVDEETWLAFLQAHCDDNARAAADLGCYPRGIVVVGQKTARNTIKGYQALIKQTKQDGVHKTILRARLKSLQFATKYFAPKLP